MKPLLTACISAGIILSAFTVRKKNKLKLPDEFMPVPAGSYYAATPEEDPYFHGLTRTRQEKDSSKIKTISSFYISRFEVTNLQYRKFYDDVSKSLSDEEKKEIKCDSTGWDDVLLRYNEPSAGKYYYRHPAYNNYPVVNISYEGAVEYCRWLQQQLQTDNPNYEIEVRLPDKSQWIWAAQGGRSQAMFPWTNYYLRNKKGEPMCNFRRVDDGAIYRNRTTGNAEVAERYSVYDIGEGDFYTTNVKSFYPNDYGLYNMCGNAAEMINESGIAMGGSWNDYGGDVHIKSEAVYETASSTIGFRPIIIAKEKNKE